MVTQEINPTKSRNKEPCALPHQEHRQIADPKDKNLLNLRQDPRHRQQPHYDKIAALVTQRNRAVPAEAAVLRALGSVLPPPDGEDPMPLRAGLLQRGARTDR